MKNKDNSAMVEVTFVQSYAISPGNVNSLLPKQKVIFWSQGQTIDRHPKVKKKFKIRVYEQSNTRVR